MKLLKNKKGMNWVPWIFRIILISMVIMGMVLFMDNMKRTILDTDDLTFYSLSQRILFSPDCFVYEDTELGKPIPGIMDFNKFTQENMDRCFVNEKSKLSAKITLDVDDQLSVYHKKDLFEEYTAFSLISPNVELITRKYPVLVMKDDEEKNGVLSIEIGWVQ